MLLDPFEKQFDLPTAAAQLGDGQRGQSEVVGEEDQAATMLRIPVTDAAQRSRITLGRVEPHQGDGLIALHAAALDHRVRNQAAKTKALARPGDEERAWQGPTIESLEVEIGTIHDVERAGFGGEQVEDIHIVYLCGGDAQKAGNRAAQIE